MVNVFSKRKPAQVTARRNRRLAKFRTLTDAHHLSSVEFGQAQRYHREEFTSRAQSYYAEEENVRGEWQGRLAANFGLRGEVHEVDFARMSEGRHPRTGEQLIERRLPH